MGYVIAPEPCTCSAQWTTYRPTCQIYSNGNVPNPYVADAATMNLINNVLPFSSWPSNPGSVPPGSYAFAAPKSYYAYLGDGVTRYCADYFISGGVRWGNYFVATGGTINRSLPAYTGVFK